MKKRIMKGAIMKKCWIISAMSYGCCFVSISLLLSIWLLLPPPASGQYDGATTWKPREVGTDELKESRGPVEDALRTRVLALFGGSELAEIREMLNKPWEEGSIKKLGECFETTYNGKLIRQDIANLIVFVAAAYRDKPIGKKAAEWIDQSLSHSLAKDDVLSTYTLSAIADYGCVELLTPTFWKYFEKGSLTCLSATVAVGNEETLAKLKGYVGGNWKQQTKAEASTIKRDKTCHIPPSLLVLNTHNLEQLLKDSKNNGQDQGLAAPLRKKPAPYPESPK